MQVYDYLHYFVKKYRIYRASAQSFREIFALHELWKDLGFDRALSRRLRVGMRQLDAEVLVRTPMTKPSKCCALHEWQQ